MKRLLVIISMLVVMTSGNVFAKDRVAIVGNSLASNFCYYNNIEGENIFGNAWVTKHAVGGDEFESYGLPYELETVNYGILPRNFGKGNISSIINEAQNYDYIICFFGSNYVHKWKKKIQNIEDKEKDIRQFGEKYKFFVESIRKNNPSVKIILMLIPNARIGSVYSIKEEELKQWNREIKKIADNYVKNQLVVYEEMTNMSFANMDMTHYDKESNKALWERIIKKYGIQPYDEPEPYRPEAIKKKGRMNQ